ncbi:MAG: hypothetical protein ACXVFF_13510, partial [Gaiellaceae bacterium]
MSLAFFGIFSLAISYIVPVAQTLAVGGHTISALRELTTPTLEFPPLKQPAVTKNPAVVPPSVGINPYAAARQGMPSRHAHGPGSVRVPVVSNSYTTRALPKQPGKQPQLPTYEDSLGVETAIAVPDTTPLPMPEPKPQDAQQQQQQTTTEQVPVSDPNAAALAAALAQLQQGITLPQNDSTGTGSTSGTGTTQTSSGDTIGTSTGTGTGTGSNNTTTVPPTDTNANPDPNLNNITPTNPDPPATTDTSGTGGSTGGTSTSTDPSQTVTLPQDTTTGSTPPTTTGTGTDGTTATSGSGDPANGTGTTATGAGSGTGTITVLVGGSTTSTSGGSTSTTPTGTDGTPPDPTTNTGSGLSPPQVVSPTNGGTISSADSSATVSFGPSSVASDTQVSVTTSTTAPPASLQTLSPVYDLHAQDVTSGTPVSTFSAPPTLTIHYNAVPGVTPQIYYLDPVNGPTPISSTVDLANQTISAQLPHFSDYVVATGSDTDLILTTTSGDDALILTTDPAFAGHMLLYSTNGAINDYSFATPTTLAIHMDSGNDSIVLQSLGTLVGTNLTIDGGDGSDLVSNLVAIPGANITNVEAVSQGLPSFTEQGPGAISTSPFLFPDETDHLPAAGAINSVAIDRVNPNVMYIGSVNGGVWRTTDGGHTWAPLTDQFPSLAIGAVAIAPRDSTGALLQSTPTVTPTNQLVVYAGTGGFSSSWVSGFAVGLLRSANGGDTWQLLAPATLAGLQITAVVPLNNGSADPNAQTVLVAASGLQFFNAGQNDTRGGIFRSTDSGGTFTRMLVGTASDLVADPSVPGRVYAALTNGAHTGIARSDDFGQHWIDLGSPTLPADHVDNNSNGVVDEANEVSAAGSARIRLAVRQNQTPAAGNPNGVYAALISDVPNSHLMGIFVSTPTGTGAAPASWTQSGWALAGSAAAKAPAPSRATINNGNTAAPTLLVSFDGPNPAGPGHHEYQISRVTGDWQADGFALGQNVIVEGGPADVQGTYKVTSVTALALGLDHAFTPHAAPLDVAAPGAAADATHLSITGEAEVPLTVGGSLSDPDRQPQPNRGNQGTVNLALVVDGAGNIFLSGDAGVADGFGQAYLFNVGSGSWTQLVDQTIDAAPNRPHADTRNLVLDPTGADGSAAANTGHLFSVNDGGIYALDLNTRSWAVLNADPAHPGESLRISETLSVAFDALNGYLFGGSQDNGSYQNTLEASDGIDNDGNGLIDDPAERFPWLETFGGDGNTALAVPVDLDGNHVIDHVIHFVMANNLNFFVERLYDASGSNSDLSGNKIESLPALGARNLPLAVQLTAHNTSDTFTTAATFTLPITVPYLLANAGGHLPTGASANIPYFIEFTDATHTVFALHAFAPNGPVAQFSDDGTGTTTLVPVQVFQQGANPPAATGIGLGVNIMDAIFLTSFPTIPYVSNVVESNRMLMGLCNLYESSNYLTTVGRTGPNATSCTFTNLGDRYSALAYGGSKSGHDRWEVIYAAKGNVVNIRLPNSPTSMNLSWLSPERISTASIIRDIVLDPRDYSTAYAATDVGIFKRVGTNNWQLISQNLVNANFKAVAFVPGPGATDGVLLVGSGLGVFRAFNPAPRVQWTELGTNLPNALVSDLLYTNIDPATLDGAHNSSLGSRLLAVGTQGRGVWTITANNSVLTQQPVLQITGRDGDADTFVVSRDADNASLLVVTLNGVRIFATSVLSVREIDINGLGGNDTLTVDSTNGSLALPGGINFTGGDNADELILAGGNVHGVKSVATGTGGRKLTIDDVLGGGTEVVVFTDVHTTDGDQITDHLVRGTVVQRAEDALRRLLKSTNAGTELAILGRTLPRVLTGSAPKIPAPVADHGPGETESSDEGGAIDLSSFSGIERLFEFPDGTSLLDKFLDGSITSVADLVAQLQALIDTGTGNVSSNGSETTPEVTLDLTKPLDGDAGIEISYDQFGGHVSISGEAHVSLDVNLHIVFGVNAAGDFYLRTDGATPEISFTNIHLDGLLDGDGQLGFLGVELENATLTINNVTVAIDLNSTGGTLSVYDLDPSQLEDLGTFVVTGPPTEDDAVVTADVKATALLPGMDEPFDLGAASVTLRWADISQPTNVSVSYTGGIGDFLKVGTQQLLDLLTQLRDAASFLSGTVPGLSNGLDDVIRAVKAFDDNVVQGLTDGVTGGTNFGTIQSFVSNVGQQFNTELSRFHLNFSAGKLTWDMPLDFDFLNGTVGFSGLQAHLSNLRVKLSIDFSKLIDLGTSFSIAQAFSVEVSGDVTDINVFDIFTGGSGFAIARKIVNANVDGGTFDPLSGTDLQNAVLMELGLDLNEASVSDPETKFLQIGSDTVGLRLEDGQIAIASLSPSDSADTRRWTAVKAVGLTGRLALGSIVTASATGADISINQGSGTTAALNWTTAIDVDQNGTFNDPVVVDTGPSSSLTIGFTTQLTSVSGNLESLTVADGLVTGSAHFAITKTLVGVHLSTGDLTGAVLLTLGLSSLDLHIGTGAVNLEIHDGSLTIASLTAPAATSPATDTRTWLAVTSDLQSVTFHGIPGLSLDVSELHFALNTADGTFTSGTAHDAEALDWTTSLDLNGNATFGEPVASDTDKGDQLDVGGTLIGFTGALVEVSAAARINIADLVTGQITFSFKQQTVAVDADGNGVFDPSATLPGTPTRGPPDLSGAMLTTLGLGFVDVSIGTPALGIRINGGTIGVALITPSAADAAAGDSRSWLAVTAADLSGGITASPLLDLVVSEVFVQVNRASGTYHDSTIGDFDARVLDWTADVDLNGDGHGDNVSAGDIRIELTNDRFAVGGRVTELHIGGFINSTDPIGFSFSHQHVDVNLDNSVPVLSGADLYTIGLDLSAVSLHFGIGGLQASLHGGTLAVALITAPGAGDSRYWLAVKAAGFGGSLTITTLASATLTSVALDINTFGGSATPPQLLKALDWTTGVPTVVVDVPTSPVSHVTIDETAQLLKLSGQLSGLSLFDGLVASTGSIGFSVTRRLVDVSTTGGPTADVHSANLVTLGLNLNTGSISIGRSGFGTTLSSGSIAFGLITPPDAPGAQGVPLWVEQGPRPIINTVNQTVPPNNPAAGAVQAIAINPANSNEIYVGTVNGGIWRTQNASATSPGGMTWAALTDGAASLAIGAIAFSPLDSTNRTLYAGTGAFSNLTWITPPTASSRGVLRTTDGGATWLNFAVNPANEGRIMSIVPTSIDLDAGAGVQQVVLVAEIAPGGGGLYRSNDNGESYSLLSGANGLPTGAVTSLIVDPNNAAHFFAGVPGQGVYSGVYSSGTGIITWSLTNSGLAAGDFTSSINIQLAAHTGATNPVLYVGFGDNAQTLTGVYRSTNGAGTWISLGAPATNAFSPSGSGFNLVVDPVNDQIVYVSGLADANGVMRLDPGTGNWVSIVGAGNTAGNTSPHADSRDLVFLGNDVLLDATDGGLYFLRHPMDALHNSWGSFDGETASGRGLGAAELHDVTWDGVSGMLIAGAQDNGVSYQQTAGALVWNFIAGGDGGDVAVDALTLAGSNQSIRYYSSQTLFDMRRQVFDANGQPVGPSVQIVPDERVNFTGVLPGFTPPFTTPTAVNVIAPPAGQSARVVVGGRGANPVYESTNAGIAATLAAVVWTAVPVAPSFGGATVTSLVAGGRRLGVDNADVLYVGTDQGLFVRTTTGGTLNATALVFPGGAVTDVAVDPEDWQHAFVSGSSGIWETTDGGASWTQRTGDLAVTDIHTVAYAKQGAVDVVLVGGHGAVARMISSTPATWTSYGTLPGADVYDLDYNAATDVLAAATLGRGAWTVSHASATLAVNFVPGHTDNRYWFTVEGTGLGGSLNLGPVASATLSGVSISFNTFGGQYDADPASVLDWHHSVDLNTGAATFGADAVVVDIPGDSPITLDLTSGGLHLAGNVTDLSVAAGLITGHSGFSITLDTVDADLNGDNTIDAAAGDVNDGSLFTLSLTGLHLNIGTSDFGVSITGGEVDIAALTPAAPTGPATDTRQWVGIQASGLSGSLTLGTVASASVSGLTIHVNKASGTLNPDGTGTSNIDASPLSWSVVDTDEAGSYAATGVSGVSLASGDPLLVEGDLTSLSLAGGFVTGSAHFKLTRSLVGVHLASGDLTDAVLLALELSSLNLNFGAGAVSFEIHGGSLALASLSAPAVTSPASDNRVWLAIKGSVSSITFHGIPGLSLDLTALTVSVNTASGSFDDGAGHTGDASALDWTHALDLNGDASFGDPGTPPSGDQLEVGGSPIDFTGAFIQVSGTAQVNIFGFVSGTVGFTFKQQTVNLDANGDGVFAPGVVPSTPIRGPPDLPNAVLTTLDLTIGSGGLFIGSPGGVGIHITSGSLAVATLSPSKADITAGDSRSWLALKARDFSGSLTGIPVIQFDAQHINIDLNQASGAFTNTDGAFPARVVDWAHDLDLNRDGTFADSLSIGGKAIDYPDELIHAQGDITTLNVADLVSGSAHFDVTRKLIKVNQGGSFDASLVTFALSSLHLSVGTSTFGVSITGGSIAIAAITPTLSTDTRRWVAVVGHDLGASLNLGGFVTATLDNVELQVNNFSGGATVLDWTHNLDLNNDTTFGGPADQLIV